MQLEFIEKIPAQSDCAENLEDYFAKILKANEEEIKDLRLKTKLAGQKFRQTKETEDWQKFAKARATLAGKISGFKKIARQKRKIHFITTLLETNSVASEDINYTLIQFISKFLDGRELDKEECQLIHNREYKRNKIKYAIPNDKKPLWTAFKLMYVMTKPKSNVTTKIIKI